MQRKFTFAVDNFYHVYNRGTEKRKIYLNQKDYQRFLILLYLCNNNDGVHLSDYRTLMTKEIFQLPVRSRLVAIGAYCLMPNHFHLLVKETTERGIARFMQKLLTGYSMYFNKKYERSGSLFQGTFKASPVDNDPQLRYVFSYIHLNPIKLIDPLWREHSQKVSHYLAYLDSYTYSSYLEHCRGQKQPKSTILSPEAFPRYFSTYRESLDDLADWLHTEPEDTEPED